MIYIDEEGKTQCTECCLSCEENKKTCEARKERGRRANRMAYKAKKEYERKKGTL
ncbi:hypothetical protein [Tissierella sp. P1]|uniref:hypothetical protein n=1 Tax=Tissierella sp. P1 TaxID=1280483 RepID=UPI0013032A2F|nr:hypothetical protein [Tissierella sp. P1]